MVLPSRTTVNLLDHNSHNNPILPWEIHVLLAVPLQSVENRLQAGQRAQDVVARMDRK